MTGDKRCSNLLLICLPPAIYRSEQAEQGIKPPTDGVLQAVYKRARSVVGEDLLPNWESTEEESVTLRRIRFLNEIEEFVGVLMFLLDMASFVIWFLPFVIKSDLNMQLRMIQYLKWADFFLEFIFLVELYLVIRTNRHGTVVQALCENLHLVLALCTEVPGLVSFGYALIVIKLVRMVRWVIV